MRRNGIAFGVALGLGGASASAQEADLASRLTALEAELAQAQAVSAYVDNTFLFLVSGMVVMFMAAGFCMLEAGLVRQKNAATICLKNISLYALAGLAFYLCGYELMYGGQTPFFGVPGPWAPSDSLDTGYASASDWFFQMVFVATAASVVSGALAERIKLWPFLIFVVLLCGLIYPIQGAWKWGGGWLDALGFQDFAGSTLVHSTGGWAALTGAILLGPRTGKFDAQGRVRAMPGSNLPLAALGTFVLWMGWFGFNGGSQLALGTEADANAVAMIFANTNTAAAAGVVAAMALSQVRYGKVDLTLALNGAIGGLVSITAGPLDPALWQAMIIGGLGGILVVLVVPLLDRLRIDDVVGAIAAHLACGIWGTLAVAWTTQAEGLGPLSQLGVQALGVLAIGLFVSIASALIWLALKASFGIRASQEDEYQGLDIAECGLEAYPEFSVSGKAR
ncbi:MAG: ammonium transporter [Maricaulaceae bacterium]